MIRYWFKGSVWLDMVVELRVQYCAQAGCGMVQHDDRQDFLPSACTPVRSSVAPQPARQACCAITCPSARRIVKFDFCFYLAIICLCRSQMISTQFLYNTALSTQLPFLARHYLYMAIVVNRTCLCKLRFLHLRLNYFKI